MQVRGSVVQDATTIATMKRSSESQNVKSEQNLGKSLPIRVRMMAAGSQDIEQVTGATQHNVPLSFSERQHLLETREGQQVDMDLAK